MKGYRIVLIRHGRTDENVKGAYLGAGSDVALSEEGSQELFQFKRNWICPLENPYIIASPMLRCRKTAELLFGKVDTVIEDLKEIDFGQFEGQTYETLKDLPYYQSWIDSGGTIPFPEGEDRESFIRRSLRGFFEGLAYMDSRGVSQAAVVCHGGSIMAIMSQLTDGDYFDFQVKNLEGYVIEFYRDEKDVIHDLSYDGLCHRLFN